LIDSNCLCREGRKINKMAQGKSGDVPMAMFAAGLAHELGNPIDAVRRYVNLAAEQAIGDPVTREYLLKAQKGIFQTLFVLNELVAYSRECHHQPTKIVEIHSFLERSLNGLSEEEKFRDISIRKNFHSDPMYVEDRGLLIVFHNLYKNAVQAMKGQGTLTLETWRQNGSVGVAVQDTGKGVPEKIKKHIFEPFFSTKKQIGGTGIGLALSRGIVERCGGELRCENVTDPNPGARFVLILPRKSPDCVLETA